MALYSSLLKTNVGCVDNILHGHGALTTIELAHEESLWQAVLSVHHGRLWRGRHERCCSQECSGTSRRTLLPGNS